MIRQKVFGACVIIINLIAAAAQSGNQVPFDNRAAYPEVITRLRPARPLRVAFIGFGPSANVADARAIETSFKEALARDARVRMVEPAQLQAALAGIKYDGSINLSK